MEHWITNWRRLAPRLGLTALFGALLGCQAGVRSAEPAVPARVAERLGELEIIEHGTIGAAGDSGRSTTMSHWTLRWKGEPVLIDTRAGMWADRPLRTGRVNALFILGEGDDAEVIVNVGDPNNAAAFHVLRREGGQLQAPMLCLALAGNSAVRPLGADGSPVAGQRTALHGPTLRRLGGARRVMLGDYCVYDVAGRRAWRVTRSPEVSVWSRELVVLSPDGRSLVRLGTPPNAARPADPRLPPQPYLLVLDLEPIEDPTDLRARGGWDALEIDRRRMRYADDHEIDAAWLEHHFHWRRDSGGRDRLVVRQGIVPLPWRGHVSRTHSQYDLQAVERNPAPVLAEFLQRRFGATPLPPDGAGDARPRLQLRGETVVLSGVGLYVERAGRYWPGQPGDPAVQQALVEEIGAAFDAELAAGRHQQLFDPVD